MTPILPILLVGGGLLLLRRREQAAKAAAGTSSSPGGLGSKLGRPLTQSEKAEFRRRAELSAMLGGKRKKGSAEPASPAAPPMTTPAAPAAPAAPPLPKGLEGCLDDGMPAELIEALVQAWQTKDFTALQFAEAASVLLDEGWPKASACFAKKAEQMVEKAGGLPFVIRSGDIPSLMAAYYTGNGARFKELGKLNKKLGRLVTTNGVTNYEKWIVGTEILIPAAWKPLSKPVPPTASAAPKDSDLVAAT